MNWRLVNCNFHLFGQQIDPKGSTVLAGFEDGVVRTLVIARQDHQDTKKSSHLPQAQLLLKQAFKPHTKAVRAMAIDSKGELLATGVSGSGIFVDGGVLPRAPKRGGWETDQGPIA